MKTTKTNKNNNSNSHSSKPFFTKNENGGFFSQTKEVEKPFFSPSPVQTKLMLGQPNDIYEKEAETTAEEVVQRLDNPSQSSPPKTVDEKNNIQLVREDEGENKVSLKSIFDSNEDIEVQREPFENQLKSSKGKGQPLPKGNKEDMENSFETDFSNVRIHTDSNAVQMNEQLRAKAFTHKNDIYFNRGQFSTNSKEGKRLIAHELTHVKQQGFGASNTSAQKNSHVSKNDNPSYISMKRDPNKEDKKRLTEFDLYIELLKVRREEVVQEVKEKVDGFMLQNKELLEQAKSKYDTLGDKESQQAQQQAIDIANLENYISWYYDKMEKDIKEVDEAIGALESEKIQYNKALEHAKSGEKIVWHTSKIGAGWLPKSLSLMQKSMESSPFWGLGYKAGQRYVLLRKQGKSVKESIATVAAISVGDLTGITNLVEAIKGKEVVTGKDIPTDERILKGVIGVMSVVTLAKVGGPRISGWTKGIRGTQVRFMQTPSGGLFPVLAVGEAGTVLALTHAEVVALVSAGHLNLVMSSLGGPSNTNPISGLNNANWGKPRGGGGKAKDREYAKKLTGSDDAAYVNGVEFDGYKKSTRTLLDAKRTKGKGSWYDTSGTDNFTKNFKIPEILKQARRQINALSGSGASKIEWHFSDADIAKQIRALFSKNGITEIKVLFTPN